MNGLQRAVGTYNPSGVDVLVPRAPLLARSCRMLSRLRICARRCIAHPMI
jgi:hypothetical protein